MQKSTILVELQEFMGNDRKIAESAWTSSFDKSKREQKTDAQVTDIVQRLAKDGHSTPFESVVFRFWIRMPIHTDRQFMTHRIQSASGLSGRYRTMPTDFYEIPPDVQEILNKTDKGSLIYSDYQWLCQKTIESYNNAINHLKIAERTNIINNSEFKRAREIIRGQLPLSVFTERTSIMNLRSFANFQKLRGSKHAQPEIQKVAKLMLDEVKKANICPIAIESLEKKNWLL
ncbi:MAG: FAD-dependent thymidylate synthase [Richelia sp. RM2_1_2]|nr:FAD-dependent thymidylate synthase [Richelia sp. RM2_1_2]